MSEIVFSNWYVNLLNKILYIQYVKDVSDGHLDYWLMLIRLHVFRIYVLGEAKWEEKKNIHYSDKWYMLLTIFQLWFHAIVLF